MSSNLLAEIFFIIFSYLYDTDVSLLNCVMVSQYWARIAIPILWQNPFRHYNHDDEKIKSLKRIICDKKISINFLKKIYPSTFFPYLEYIKVLDIHQIKKLFKEVKEINIQSLVINNLLKFSDKINIIHID